MIHLFCALSCEAEPIIQYFNLFKIKEFDLFRLYQSGDKNITLTITGVGKINAAAAVTFHHACLSTSPSDIWLNVGIAGHSSIPIGEVCLINKITDYQYGTTWYPQILFEIDCTSAALITHDAASSQYQNSLFDMEASGFYQMALRLGTAELIHCLKIVSDNQQHSVENIKADHVKKLITKNKLKIVQLLNSLKPLAKELSRINTTPECYQTLIDEYHLTQTERIQLLRLLNQWSVRFPNDDIMCLVSNIKNGKSLQKKIKTKLIESDFSIYD